MKEYLKVLLLVLGVVLLMLLWVLLDYLSTNLMVRGLL